MRLHKCLNQTIDLDHVLAVSDVRESIEKVDMSGGMVGIHFEPCRCVVFDVTLALRDSPLRFVRPVFSEPDELKNAHVDLLAAWSKSGAEGDA